MLATFASRRNIYLLLGRMEAQYRANRAYQQHAKGNTSGGDVPADIHPGERVQEMEGGEADAEVVWLARWRATRGGLPQFLSCSHDEQEKGGDSEIFLAMHRGTTSLRRRWRSQECCARGL